MANVRYWQVSLTHRVDEQPKMEVIGVVADTEEDARKTCIEGLQAAEIHDVMDCGHVRFIRHTWRGPNTEVTVEGKPVDAVRPE